MIRCAAKNLGWVGVVVDPADYDVVLDELKSEAGLAFETRKRLSAKAFGHTAKYDTLIHDHFKGEPLSDDFSVTFEKHYDLRSGKTLISRPPRTKRPSPPRRTS